MQYACCQDRRVGIFFVYVCVLYMWSGWDIRYPPYILTRCRCRCRRHIPIQSSQQLCSHIFIITLSIFRVSLLHANRPDTSQSYAVVGSHFYISCAISNAPQTASPPRAPHPTPDRRAAEPHSSSVSACQRSCSPQSSLVGSPASCWRRRRAN